MSYEEKCNEGRYRQLPTYTILHSNIAKQSHKHSCQQPLSQDSRGGSRATRRDLKLSAGLAVGVGPRGIAESSRLIGSLGSLGVPAHVCMGRVRCATRGSDDTDTVAKATQQLHTTWST